MGFKNATILIVDDDIYVRESLREILSDAGYTALEATDGKMALDLLTQQNIDLLLLDLDLPRVPGMEVLRQVTTGYPNLEVVIISGKGTIQQAVEATRLGAYDFLEKPLETQRTLITIRNAVEKLYLVRQSNRLVEEIRERYKMVGTSPAMQQIYRLIDKAGASQSRVLIMGESGTGKELIARAIHHNGPRATGPFLPVNCSAIPENLIESELFGHYKGAFTGAQNTHRGKFEQANGGTLFLDEIGDTSLIMQAKILRVLEENCLYRVGGEQAIPVDVLVLTATNKNLEEEIKKGSFREDLYYRLNVLTIEVPPLRSHREDISLLIDYFITQICTEKRLPIKELSKAARTVLLAHDWPGNIRELRNTLERLIVLSEGETISYLEAGNAIKKNGTSRDVPASLTLHTARDQFEKEFILETLITTDWKILETAKILGIERSHLWKKMQKLGIEKGEM